MLQTLKSKIKIISKLSILREMSWYTLSNFFLQISSFFSMIFVSRYLGPTNLGLYSFVQNYAATLFTVLSGSDFYFSWAIAKSENIISDIKKFTVYRIYMALVLTILGIVGAYIVLPEDVAMMCIIMLAPTVLNSFSTFYFLALRDKRAKLVATIQIITALIMFILKVSLVFLHAPLYAFIYVASFDLAIASLIYCVYFLRGKSFRNLFLGAYSPSITETFSFLYSIRLSIVVIFLWQLLLRADQLILAKVTNAYLLGIYTAAAKIAEVPNVIAGVIYLAMISRMVPLIKTDSSYTHNRLRYVFYLYLLIGVVFSISIIILAPLAVNIIYGAKFVESIPVLRVYALSIPGAFLTYFFFSLFGAAERNGLQAIIFFVSVILNILLVILLTPLYGLMGAAFATSITYTLSGFMFYLYWRRKV